MTTLRTGSLSVEIIETPSLGDRSYLAHDGNLAVVFDPQRDYDRVLAAASRAGVRIAHVFETHIHNDYVTGGFALAQAVGAGYHVNAADPVTFDRSPISDGDVVVVSDTMAVRAMATPGHTFTHMSYVLEEIGADGARESVAIFSGGSLLFGATGRPDLLGPDHTQALVHHQHDSVHRIAADLPDHAHVLPTHGFGSFCSAGSTGGATASTIGEERVKNPALTLAAEQWIAETLAGLEAWPAYYAHMGPANLLGPGTPDLTQPTPADRESLARSLAAGEWVVDLRDRKAFAGSHVVGTLNFGGDDAQFSTYLGWLFPWGTPLTLVGESAEQVAAAQRELVRIGIDQLAGSATGEPADWTAEELGSFPTGTFADLEHVRHHREVVVLDVRRPLEYDESHIAGAVNIPIHQILQRLEELPRAEIWVHCAAGYRASIVASVLAAAGHHVVAVDDDFVLSAGKAGLGLTTSAAESSLSPVLA